MASSPYSYTQPLSFYRDVCQTNETARKDDTTSPKPAPVREPLNSWGERLLAELPPTIRLDFTAKRYPHIVNKLAVIWNDARELTSYINNLLVDDRANRQGFEFETLNELADVRNVRIAALRAWQSNPRR